MHGEHNLLFGLTNDAFGYILTKVDWGSFQRYDYVSRTCLGEMTGEIYIEKALEFVNRCPRPPRVEKSSKVPVASSDASERSEEAKRRRNSSTLRPVAQTRAGAVARGKTALVIVPDGVLSEKNRYLIGDAAISYAPSLTVLREMMKKRHGQWFIVHGAAKGQPSTVDHSRFTSLFAVSSIIPIASAPTMDQVPRLTS